jgi:hypothetical protein
MTPTQSLTQTHARAHKHTNTDMHVRFLSLLIYEMTRDEAPTQPDNAHTQQSRASEASGGDLVEGVVTGGRVKKGTLEDGVMTGKGGQGGQDGMVCSEEMLLSSVCVHFLQMYRKVGGWVGGGGGGRGGRMLGGSI